MATMRYTVAVGYGKVQNEPNLGDGAVDAEEIEVVADSSAKAIVDAVTLYMAENAEKYPDDDVVYANVVSVSAKKPRASPPPVWHGTPRRRSAPTGRTSGSSSGARGRGGRGRRRA